MDLYTFEIVFYSLSLLVFGWILNDLFLILWGGPDKLYDRYHREEDREYRDENGQPYRPICSSPAFPSDDCKQGIHSFQNSSSVSRDSFFVRVTEKLLNIFLKIAKGFQFCFGAFAKVWIKIWMVLARPFGNLHSNGKFSEPIVKVDTRDLSRCRPTTCSASSDGQTGLDQPVDPIDVYVFELIGDNGEILSSFSLNLKCLRPQSLTTVFQRISEDCAAQGINDSIGSLWVRADKFYKVS